MFRPSVLTPEIPKGCVVYFVSQRTPTWSSTNDLHKWGKNKIWENISTWVPLCMYWCHHGGVWGPLQEKYQHYYVLVLEHNMTIKGAWPNIGWDAVWACNSSRANAETEFTENKRLSIWQLCRHWWHPKLSLIQLMVPPVMTKLSNWQIFVVSGLVIAVLADAIALDCIRPWMEWWLFFLSIRFFLIFFPDQYFVIFVYLIFMSQIVLYFLYSTSLLSFYIKVVSTLSMDCLLGSMSLWITMSPWWLYTPGQKFIEFFFSELFDPDTSKKSTISQFGNGSVSFIS